ncbi:MAG: 4Fe-4S binding protein [Fastidiosipilaceae bacterium]|jgi:ferredoxin
MVVMNGERNSVFLKDDIRSLRVGSFSPTGNSRLAAHALAGALNERLRLPLREERWQAPEELLGRREDRTTGGLPERHFAKHELTIISFPVYAGRLPNLLLPFLRTLRGDGTPAVAMVTFGNRSPDDAPFELTQLLNRQGFVVVAQAAIVGQHAFSKKLAAGRPDEQDLNKLNQLAARMCERLETVGLSALEVDDRRREPKPYYVPRGEDGKPIDIRRVKPGLLDSCVRCGLCARICPTGAIDPLDVANVPGICVKCGACVKYCPVGAREFTDPDYLYHVWDLETRFIDRAESEILI